MKSLIKNDIVIEIHEQEFPVHPSFLWVDCDNTVQVGWSYIDGQFAPPVEPLKTQAEILAEYQASIHLKLDEVAKEKGYDDRLSIASYYISTNRTWAQESQKFCKWRDAVYEYALSILTQIEIQEIEPPALQDFINDMPQAPW